MELTTTELAALTMAMPKRHRTTLATVIWKRYILETAQVGAVALEVDLGTLNIPF